MSTSQQKALDDFVQLRNRNAMVHVIRTAVDLGILQALSTGQKTIEQLAEQLNLKQEPLVRLMNVLANSELVDRYGDDFALSTIAKLIPSPNLDFGDHYWQQLARHIREGMRLPADETVPHQEEDYLNQRASEEWTLTPIALDVAEVLDVGKSRRGLRVLEIGCGSAVFASTIAHRDADSVINLLDTQAGLRQAQKTIESIGLGRQTELIEVSDPFAIDSIPELEDQLFDLILVVGIVHRLQQERFQKLFRDIYPLIKPERELAVIDVFPGQEKGELQRSIFELELGLRTHHGQLHEPAVLESALKEAGFSHLQYAHLPSAPHYWGLLLAQRG